MKVFVQKLPQQISGFIVKKRELIVNLKDAGLYFLGSIVQSVLALIAQPIYSMHLSASEFGILGYFEAIRSVLVPVFILGMTSYYLMRYFKQSETDNKILLFNITFFLFCFNSLIILISYAGIYFYFEEMNVSIPLNPFAWFILVALLLDNIKSFVLINYRIRKKAMSFFVFSAINSLLNFGLGLLFVAYFKWGAEGRMLAPIISSLAILPYALFILMNYSTIIFKPVLFFKAAIKVFPLVLAAYAYVPMVSIDRFFLERLNNLPELGLYNIGITIAGYVHLAYIALGSALEPDIFKAVAEKDYKRLIRSGLIIFLPYLLVILIFLMLSGTIISILTAGRYVAAEKYTNLALISVFLMGLYWFLDKIFIALEKTKMNLLINTIGGIFSIIIIYLAIDKYQFLGAIYGKVLAILLVIITSSILVIKNLRAYKYGQV
jgi:O-antigen/teichoic acid export membrane protein